MTLITAKNGKARPKNTSEQYDWLTKEEFEEEYSRNEFVKILKLHNHESLPDTNITKTSIYELERACQSHGSCSNCSGVSCAMVGVVDPVYNAFESTVQWRDCPEATEDGEYEAELQWQCMYSWKSGQWIDVSDEWYEDMKDATANKYRQIYKLVTDHVEPTGTWLPGLYDILSGEERIGVYLDQKTIEYYKSINKWFQPSKTVRIVPQPQEKNLSLKASMKFERLIYNNPKSDGDSKGKRLGHFVYDHEKQTETFIPIAQNEEAKTVEGNQSQAAFDIYEKNCVRDANLIIPVNPVITVVESIIEYSTQQNKALQKRLDNAVNFATGIICIELLKIPSELLVKYKIDIDSVVVKLEEALKPTP